RYLVEGGAGGRPAPPAPWPMRWPGIVTWPLLKACEAHVVLIWLTGLAALAAIAPSTWDWTPRIYVATMALLAPALATGRIARSARRNSVTAEFDRWFQPWPDDRSCLVPPAKSAG